MLPNCSQMLFFFWFDCQADPARELIVKSWKRGGKTFHGDQNLGARTGWAWHNHSQPRSHFWPGSTEFPIQDDHLHDGSGLVFFFYFFNFYFFLQAFGVEFLITMVLVLVVFASAADDNNKDNVKVCPKSTGFLHWPIFFNSCSQTSIF